MKKTILLILALLFCVECAGAWQIHSDKYSGTVEFFEDGTGVAKVDGYPFTVTFSWIQTGDVQFEARYLIYQVPFEYDSASGIITSSGFPGAYLTRV